ncbi:hypothetical protein [Porphyromonas macacae]|uniref:hypothetical protein n=1 Tax=Porphyromonas macacae TaxID=28115 RepID=UPI00359FBF66
MVENPSGKEKKSKLTWIKIRQAENFEPSGKDFQYTSMSQISSLKQIQGFEIKEAASSKETASVCSYKRFVRAICSSIP